MSLGQWNLASQLAKGVGELGLPRVCSTHLASRWRQALTNFKTSRPDFTLWCRVRNKYPLFPVYFLTSWCLEMLGCRNKAWVRDRESQKLSSLLKVNVQASAEFLRCARFQSSRKAFSFLSAFWSVLLVLSSSSLKFLSLCKPQSSREDLHSRLF